MGRFDEILNAPEPQETIEVEIVKINGVENVTATEGITVKQFKQDNGLDGVKLIDDATDTILSDSDVIEDGMTIFVSTSKENG